MREFRDETADRFGIPLTQHFPLWRDRLLLPKRDSVFLLFGLTIHQEQAAGAPRKFGAADVAQDGEEPRLHRRSAIRIEMAQRAQIAFLHGVFGIGAIAQQISRQCVNIVEMRQRGVAKTPRFVVVIAVPVSRHYVVPGFPGCRSALSLRSIEHYCTALLPVAASTTIAPVMCGCNEQKYS